MIRVMKFSINACLKGYEILSLILLLFYSWLGSRGERKGCSRLEKGEQEDLPGQEEGW